MGKVRQVTAATPFLQLTLEVIPQEFFIIKYSKLNLIHEN